MGKDLVRISRFLSLVLRHDPGRIGLELDGEGWASVADLVERPRLAGVDKGWGSGYALLDGMFVELQVNATAAADCVDLSIEP